MISLVLQGHVPSKKNARRIRAGQAKAYLPAQITADIDALVIQANSLRHRLDIESLKGKRLGADVVFYLKKEHEDLDNAWTTLQDVLQKARIIENDAKVRDVHYRDLVDPTHLEQVAIDLRVIE